ncbi:hypothetical protein J6590_082822 [Homalodisca vitripennis]|nr:hypothetical protein J6590_082822 [Homalodisca vitripennis]
MEEEVQEIQTPQQKSPSSITVSPTDINPVPSLSLLTTSNSRAGSAAVVSASPFKNALLGSIDRTTKGKRQLTYDSSKSQAKKKKRNRKKGMPSPDSTDDDEDPPYVSTDDSDSSYGDGDDAQCGLCVGSYSSDKNGETWLKCKKCFLWFHEACDKRKSKTQKFYVCQYCSQ